MILATDPLSFLCGCREFQFARDLLCVNDFSRLKRFNEFSRNRADARTLCLLRALSDMNALCLDFNTRPAYTHAERCYFNPIGRVKSGSQSCGTTLLAALMELLNIYDSNRRSEFYVSELICNGWICAQNDGKFAYRLVQSLHYKDETRREVALRIIRQLLALGFFRNQEPRGNRRPQFPRECSHKDSHLCRRLDPLIKEFFENTLSLQQLSRVQICQ